MLPLRRTGRARRRRPRTVPALASSVLAPGDPARVVPVRSEDRLCRSAEQVRGQLDSVALELAEESGAQAGRMESSDDLPLGVEAIDLEFEELLEGDHLALHSLNLGDFDHAAGAVVEPVELDDQIERGCHVAPDRPE